MLKHLKKQNCPKLNNRGFFLDLGGPWVTETDIHSTFPINLNEIISTVKIKLHGPLNDLK